MKLDTWQKEILQTKGNILLCSGRQVGKSTIVSIRASEYAAQNNKKSVLIISATERQAQELFFKCFHYLEDNYKSLISRGKDRPTKHIINLKNGSVIRCLPTGTAGTNIRGYTINLLIADEAAFIDEAVWSAVTPMLMTTGGDMILVSTPHGRVGYFWERYNDPTFKVFHINSEKVITERPISLDWTERQREKAKIFLESEKKRMSSLQYAQEYMGEFVDKLCQLFPDELIKRAAISIRRERNLEKDYFLGVDVARLGEDESVFSIIEREDGEYYRQVENIISEKLRVNEVVGKILELEKIWKFKRIFVDDGGVGGGVFDYLLYNVSTKKKVVAINNASRPLDKDEKRKKKTLKEDLYMNILMLFEQGKLQILPDDEIIQSFKSVQYEYVVKEDKPTTFRIFGKYTHCVESLIRACWCSRDKSLNIWCAY